MPARRAFVYRLPMPIVRQTLVSLGALLFLAALCAACGGSGGDTSATKASGRSGNGGGGPTPAKKVFLILMENHDWVDIKGSASAPYLNSLLAIGAHAEQYYNPPGLHPSEPNYVWLEAGDNFGIRNDDDPSINAVDSTAHLVTQIEAAGLTWKSYQEDIDGATCPLVSMGNYAAKHNPMVFFKDVTDGNAAMSKRCIAHVRPFTELDGDLANDTVGNYNFITPNLCNDMHDSCPPTNDPIAQGDAWLSTQIPKLLASDAYANGATVIITWDEGEPGDGPIGLIVLSKAAKIGYAGSVHYTHSSTLRTLQTIFGLSPLLGDAARATDLSDLFTTLP